MYDLYKFIAEGFGGKLKDTIEARKLIWLLIITFLFSMCCIFFIAYVSYSRYKDLAGFLPGAIIIAIFFTVGIAAFIYYASSHISTFMMESWMHGESRFAWQGVVVLFVVAVCAVVVDSRMTMDGAEDVARQAAGTVVEVDEAVIVAPYDKTIAQLETKIEKAQEKYWWKGKLFFEPAPVTRHSKETWAKDTAIVNALERQIMTAQAQKSAALSDARNSYRTATTTRDQRETVTHSRLRVAVRGVYFLQFLLTMAMAYCLLRIEEELMELEELEETENPTPNQSAASSQGTQQVYETPPFSGQNPVPSFQTNPVQQGFQAHAPIGFVPPINTPINTPIDRGTRQQEETWKIIDEHARVGAYTVPDEDYLKRHYKVVDALLRDKSIRVAGEAGEVSKTTVQNVKRVMKAVGINKTWKEVKELRK